MGALTRFQDGFHLNDSSIHFLKLNIVKGKMQYLFDENRRRYLDAFAGMVTVSCGHCHPEILSVIEQQNKLLQHATTVYLYHAIVDFAEGLAAKMLGNLKIRNKLSSSSPQPSRSAS